MKKDEQTTGDPLLQPSASASASESGSGSGSGLLYSLVPFYWYRICCPGGFEWRRAPVVLAWWIRIPRGTVLVTTAAGTYSYSHCADAAASTHTTWAILNLGTLKCQCGV